MMEMIVSNKCFGDLVKVQSDFAAAEVKKILLSIFFVSFS